MNTTYPVVIYGASGYTGRLVAEHLRDLGVPFIAAGRNRKRIEDALKLVPGIENARYEIVEVEHSVDALTKLGPSCAMPETSQKPACVRVCITSTPRANSMC